LKGLQFDPANGGLANKPAIDVLQFFPTVDVGLTGTEQI